MTYSFEKVGDVQLDPVRQKTRNPIRNASGSGGWSNMRSLIRKPHLFRARAMLALLTVLIPGAYLFAYSVLTHEEIVDLAWMSEIRPLLQRRFPDLTEDQIKEAHAYAYGGSVIQDLGYYPFGNKGFSDLVHYVRSGDFVLELIRQSQDANEYAFALGALSHYAADINGHPAVNQAVALNYPKLRARFGNSVRYAQDATAHLKTEFGFDTLQVAKNRYASEQYHDFIGFKVSVPLLERTFPVVYGLPLKDVLPNLDLAVGSYRFAISRLIPQMTKVALRVHGKDQMQEAPNAAKRKFLYRLSRSDYEREWGKTYTRPDFGTRVLSVLFRYAPKVGPFKGMGFDSPTAKTEDLYIKSINATVDRYTALLEEVRSGTIMAPNCDLDDGEATRAAEYTLADEAYAKLLARLTAQKFEGTSSELRKNILDFYSDPTSPVETKKDPARWATVQTNLSELRAALPPPVSAQPATLAN
jgi:Zinc dependent phospholipase C